MNSELDTMPGLSVNDELSTSYAPASQSCGPAYDGESGRHTFHIRNSLASLKLNWVRIAMLLTCIFLCFNTVVLSINPHTNYIDESFSFTAKSIRLPCRLSEQVRDARSYYDSDARVWIRNHLLYLSKLLHGVSSKLPHM